MNDVCTANLLAELIAVSKTNSILLQEVIITLNKQTHKVNGQVVSLGESCYDTGGSDPVKLLSFVPLADGVPDMSGVIYFNADKTEYTGSSPVGVDPCDCACKTCEDTTSACADNPPDFNIRDVGSNVVGKAWAVNIAGLSDFEVLDVGGNTLYWAMASAICDGAVPRMDIGGNTLYWVMPA